MPRHTDFIAVSLPAHFATKLSHLEEHVCPRDTHPDWGTVLVTYPFQELQMDSTDLCPRLEEGFSHVITLLARMWMAYFIHSLVFLSVAVALSLGTCSQQQPAAMVIMSQQEKRQCPQPLIIPSFVQQLSSTDLNTGKTAGYYCSLLARAMICSDPRLIRMS